MKALRTICVVPLLFLVGSLLAQPEEKPSEFRLPRTYSFGQMGIALKDDLTIEQGGPRGADGKFVASVGDRILEWNGRKLAGLDDYCRCLYASKPGDDVTLKILRPNPDKTRPAEELTVVARLGDPKKNFADLYASREKRNRSYDWRVHSVAAARQDGLKRRVAAALSEYRLGRAYDHLLAAHERELDLWDCHESLTSCELLLRDPASSQGWIEEATDALANSMSDDSAGIWQLYVAASKLMDCTPALLPLGVDWPKAEASMPSTEADVWRLKKALAALDSRPSLRQQPGDAAWGDLMQRLQKVELAWQGQPEFPELVALIKLIREQPDSRLSLLARADRALEVLLEEARRCSTWPKPHNPTPGVVAELKTPFGLVAVGGPGANLWDCQSNRYALIVDLGGDDTYEGWVAAPSGLGNPVSVIIDLAGNDTYRSKHKFGLASAAGGTGILYDAGGDDTYECAEWGIGAAFCGVGLLIDKAGNDRYRGGDMTIGCAAYGVGAVMDCLGNDIYESSVYSVGCGLPRGLGLVLDRDGDDRYRCTGKYQSGYGTQGEWQGWGIGCGFGFRSLAAGGIGAVVDLRGNDVYDAGEFGLGCGYFLGVGVVRDMKGHDIYRASRYGLAAAAHCAVGLFMDDLGNDDYQNVGPASMAGVWDIATGAMFDLDGNDSYRSGGLGLGAGSQNAVGIFWDVAGNDSYRAYDASTLGHGGGNSYGGGRLARNFGFFFDTGGEDSYTRADRRNNERKLTGEFGIFQDTAGNTPPEITPDDDEEPYYEEE